MTNKPDPIVGAEACGKWLDEHTTTWVPIYLYCEANDYMWLQSGRYLALKHVPSGVIQMIQDERFAEEDCRRLFVWGG